MKIQREKSYLNYTEEEDEIILDLLYVFPQDRRKGIGSSLVKDLISYAYEQNKNITLYAEPQMDAEINKEDLISFYERLGFEEDRDMGEREFMIFKI